MEPFILEPGILLLKKLAKSNEDIDQLFKKVESNTNLEDYTIQVGVPLWPGPSHPGPALSFPAMCPPSLTLCFLA